jgi:hypothetical protein
MRLYLCCNSESKCQAAFINATMVGHVAYWNDIVLSVEIESVCELVILGGFS